MSSSVSKGHQVRHEDTGESARLLGENIFGAMIMIVGSVALVIVAWGTMTALTSPDGWVAKAANAVMTGEAVTLTSFADASPR